MANPREDQTRDPNLPPRSAARPLATPAGGPGSAPGSAAGSVVGLPALRASRPSSSSGAARGVLVIGREIEVRGEIGSCQTLVVEGRLEAAVEVGSLELAEEGIFNGRASVETADIAGQFDGELTVRGELHLRPSARVQGTIRYGRIVIEGGGELSGDVAVLPAQERARVAEG